MKELSYLVEAYTNAAQWVVVGYANDIIVALAMQNAFERIDEHAYVEICEKQIDGTWDIIPEQKKRAGLKWVEKTQPEFFNLL